MADATPGSGAPSSNRNVMILLSYLWLLALVPLLTEKDDKEVQWHAKHGIVLMVAELILWVIINAIVVMTGPIGCLFGLLSPLVVLAQIALHIVAVMKGINGQRLIIPGISQYTDKF
jgi:uncharacterized membrane protein